MGLKSMRPNNTPSNTAIAMLVSTETLQCFEGQDWDLNIHENFQYFIFFIALNIDCGYTLESPRLGGSNVYPQSMFWSKIKKK